MSVLVSSTPVPGCPAPAHVQQAEADFDPLPFDVMAARAFGRVAASLRRHRRKVKPRAYDAMIATAVAHGLPIYTCNPSDFAGIEGLTVVAVPVTGGSAAAPEPSESGTRRRRR
jgi:hypothetical protein